MSLAAYAWKAILLKCLKRWKNQPSRLSTQYHNQSSRLTTLLLGDTNGSATSAGGLGVLSTDTESPVVSETTVSADLLEALQIVSELGVDTVGQNLGVLAVDDISLSVQEPSGDLVLSRVLDNGDDSLELFGGEFTGTKRN